MEDLSEVKHITIGDLPVSEITLGDTVVWQRPAWEPETQDILDYADLNGYTKPSYRYIVDLNFFIWNLKRFELWDEVHDLIYWMKGDGDLNFKCINLVNTSVSGTPNGGLISTVDGLKGNSSAYIESNFNLSTATKYTLNDAYRGFYLFDVTETTSSNRVDQDKVGQAASIRNRLIVSPSAGNYINSNPPVAMNTGTLGIHAVVRKSDLKIVNITKNNATEYDSPSVSIVNSTLTVLNSPPNFIISEYSIGKSINLPQTQLLGWATEGKLTAIRNQETVDLIKYAIANDIKLPSIENLYQIDRRIHNLKKWGLWTNIFDVLYLLDGDGEANFRALNIVNPSLSGTPYGGLILTPDGIEGNTVDGYIDTGFNPSLLIAGQKYQLNDASRGVITISFSGGSRIIDSTTDSGTNSFYNIGTSLNRINQFVAGGGNYGGLGTKVIVRVSNTQVYAINNNNISSFNFNSSSLPNSNQVVLRQGSTNEFSGVGLSTYFMGKSVTLPQTQIFTHILSGDIEKIHNAETKAVIEYAMDMGYKLPTLPYLLKLDQFIQDVKERGLWDKFDVLYAMRGDVGQCAEFRCINLVNPALSGTPMGGLILEDLGLEGNAVDGYIDSGFNPFVGINKYTIHNAHRTAYVYSDSATTTNSSVIDSSNGDTSNTLIIGNSIAQRINSGGFNLNEDANLSGVGFKSIVRVNGTDVELVNNDILFSRTTTGNQLHNNKQFILRGRGAFSPNGLSTYSMGSAITFEESQLLRQAILKYIA